MEEKFKTFIKVGKIISFFLVLFVGIYLLFINKIDNRLMNYYSSLHYKGKVIDKFIDEANHSYRIIILDTEERVSLPPASYKLFEDIDIGDYMHKNDSTLMGYIEKKDTTLVIDYKKSIPQKE